MLVKPPGERLQVCRVPALHLPRDLENDWV